MALQGPDLEDDADFFFNQLQEELGDGRKICIPDSHLGVADDFASLGLEDGEMEETAKKTGKKLVLDVGPPLHGVELPGEISDGVFEFPVVAIEEESGPSPNGEKPKNYQERQWSSLFNTTITAAATTNNNSNNETQERNGSFSDFLSELGIPPNDHTNSNTTTMPFASSLDSALAEVQNTETGTETKVPLSQLFQLSPSLPVHEQSHANHHNNPEPNTERQLEESTPSESNTEQPQTNWEQQYPGWFYNYQTQTWQQIVESTAIPQHDGNSLEAPLGYAASSHHSSVQHSTATANELSAAQQYPGWYYDYQAQMWRPIAESSPIDGNSSSEHVASAVDETALQVQKSATVPSDSNTESPAKMEPHQQYPGWYYDYQAQTWRQLAAESSQDGNSSEDSTLRGQQFATTPNESNTEQQYPGWTYDYQAQMWRQIAESSSLASQNHGNSLSATQGLEIPSQGQQHQPAATMLNTEQQYPGWHYDYQTQTWRQNLSQQDTVVSKANEWSGDFPKRDQSCSALYNSPHPSSEQLSQDITAFDQKQNSVSGMTTVLQTLPATPPSVLSHYPEASRGQANSYHEEELQSGYVPGLPKRSSSRELHHPETITPPRTSAEALRSSAGRPPHTAFAFGFGGKVAFLKYKDPLTGGGPDFVGGSSWSSTLVSIHNLGHLAVENADSRYQNGVAQYFKVFNRQGISGPLPGNIGMKDLLKWVDERTANCQLEEPNYPNPETLQMLWGVLKIACQHYGKLRSADASSGIDSMVEDGPEVALGKLLISTKSRQDSIISRGHLQHANLEQQLQAAAIEMKNLLVTGKRKEALECAQQGGLWGPAIVLALQLGEKYYAETVTLMARQQFVSGSPLRTLFLLLAGQTMEAFAVDPSPPSEFNSHPYGGVSPTINQNTPLGMLNEWQENLAIISANKSKEQERVTIHLGDCLWKEKSEVAGAHICYLIADATFEAPSGNARLCLLGADHFRNPRTFTSADAIQRTELYEYAKVLGNSQFVLIPFQPYKLVYANMLVEAGKVNEALRYCQSVSKNLKSAGRALEVESCRRATSELEDRLRLYSQGGYGFNLNPKKLVATLFNTIDKGVKKFIGGPPTTSLVPSASMEPVSAYTNRRKALDVPMRSFSDSGFNRNAVKGITDTTPLVNNLAPPKQSSNSEAPPKESNNSEAPPKQSSNYSGRFGFLARAVGFMRQSRKEAKLGGENKFHYDKELKRWVEEGVEPTPQEVAPPPPPVVSKFSSMDGAPPSDSRSYSGNEVNNSIISAGATNFMIGTPPLPPGGNQFSARGRLQSVRSRYVDTFNKSGNSQTPVKLFQSPVISSVGLTAASKPTNFFVPATLPKSEMLDSGSLDRVNTVSGDGPLLFPLSNGVIDADPEFLLKESISTSLATVPLIHRPSSVDGAMHAMHARPRTTATSAQHVEGNAVRAASWNGLSSYSDEKSDASSSLNARPLSYFPSKPAIRSQNISAIAENGPLSSRPSELQGQLVFGDMQEVEL